MMISANPGVKLPTTDYSNALFAVSPGLLLTGVGLFKPGREDAEDAEELFVTLIADEVRIAFVYRRNEYELERSNDHAIVLQTC